MNDIHIAILEGGTESDIAQARFEGVELGGGLGFGNHVDGAIRVVSDASPR